MRTHRLKKTLRSAGTSRSAGARPNSNFLTASLLLALGFAAPVHAANFFVYKTGDSGHGTLRQAVLDANARPGSHTIWFLLPPHSTIKLTSGQLALTGPSVTVQGLGRSWLTISGNHHSRIFDVEAGSLTLNDLTLRDGLAQGDATNSYDQAGGAIRVGALPAPLAPEQFVAELAEAHATAQTAMNSDKSARANRLGGPMATHKAAFPQAQSSTAPLALTVNRVALLDNRADAPDLSAGGAIYTEGGATLVVRDSQFSGNSTAFAGGAIFTMGSADFSPVSAGNFDIEGSLFTGNHIDQNGAEPGQGGAFESYGPGGNIRTSIFRDNVINEAPPEVSSEGEGGAIALALLSLPIRIDSTEISHNSIVLRPYVFSEGAGLISEQEIEGDITALTVSNSTISGNQSNSGAGIEVSSNVFLINTTIADNLGSGPDFDGPGDAVDVVKVDGLFNAESTLIANPDTEVDLFFYRGAANLGAVSKSLVLTPDPAGPPLPPDTIIGIDPQLAPLAYNGGPTRTQALQAGSVAIDAGSNPLHSHFDQRGQPFPRVIGPAADIGAFERCPWSHSRCDGDRD